MPNFSVTTNIIWNPVKLHIIVFDPVKCGGKRNLWLVELPCWFKVDFAHKIVGIVIHKMQEIILH